MAKKNLLESLVLSLNQSELKRLALYTKAYASNKSYMDLFKAIKNNQSKKPEKYTNKNAQQRRYLYRIILESLVQKRDKSIESEVLFLINSANYLLKKQLPEHAYHSVNKALFIVSKYEMIGYHLQLIEIEKQIRMYINPKGYRGDEEIFEEEVNLIEQQKQLQTLKAIFNHIYNYKKRYGYVDLELWNTLYREIREMGAIANVNECYTKRAAYHYYHSQTLLYFIRQSHQKAYEFSSAMIHVDPAPLSKQEYLSGMLEHSTSCLCLGRTDELLTTLSQVKNLYKRGVFGKYENIALKIFYYVANYELLAYVFEGNKEKVKAKLEEIESELEYWGSKIPVAMKMILATGLKLGYGSIGDYKKMNKEIHFLIDNYKSGLRMDAYEDGLMCNLMYIFMKDDLDYLENQALFAYRHFKKYEIKDNVDVEFKLNSAKLFLDYSRMKISKTKFLQAFKKEIEFKLSHFDNHFLEMDYPYLIWVNSQLSGKKFLETAREMSVKHLNK